MNNPGLRLQVAAESIHPNSVRVMLNDIDISSDLMSLELHMEARGVTTATIKLLPQSVEIDARAFAILQAVIPATKGIPDDV